MTTAPQLDSRRTRRAFIRMAEDVIRPSAPENLAATASLLVDGKPLVFSQADVGLVKQRQPRLTVERILDGIRRRAAVYWRFADPHECGNSVILSGSTTS
jgi:hypothetical protein